MTTPQLANLHERLAWTLKQQEALDVEWAAAEKAYNDQIEAQVKALRERLEEEHADITKARNETRERVEATKTQVKVLRDELKDGLESVIPHTGEKKPFTGISRRDSVICDLPDDDGLLVAELASTAPYLLQVNRSALNKFIRAFATETRINGAYPCLAEPMRTLMPVLGKSLEFDHTWTISDKTLLKEAPDSDPSLPDLDSSAIRPAIEDDPTPTESAIRPAIEDDSVIADFDRDVTTAPEYQAFLNAGKDEANV